MFAVSCRANTQAWHYCCIMLSLHYRRDLFTVRVVKSLTNKTFFFLKFYKRFFTTYRSKHTVHNLITYLMDSSYFYIILRFRCLSEASSSRSIRRINGDNEFYSIYQTEKDIYCLTKEMLQQKSKLFYSSSNFELLC